MFDLIHVLAGILADPPAVLIPLADFAGGWVMFDPAQGWSIQH